MKTCTKCKETKVVAEFGRDKKGRNGLRAICKTCKRKEFTAHRVKNKDKFNAYSKKWYANPENTAKVRGYWLARKFNITLADYDKMFAAQKGCCAICGTRDSGGVGPHFNVDHCHTTGVIRGLLCISCNTGIGNFKDNPGLLTTAISYLEKHL
jgi:hypothetical protein